MSNDKDRQGNMSSQQREEQLCILKARFEKNMGRHEGMAWAQVQKKLEAEPEKLWSLKEMEETGGEPDVTAYDKADDAYLFIDCSPESPAGRRSLCYDRAALESRKENRPPTSALDVADAMGIELLIEEQYLQLQKLGAFDLKTSSWIRTPDKIRKLGGSVSCDRRYDTVFTYHNGAGSYYAVRGFRGAARV